MNGLEQKEKSNDCGSEESWPVIDKKTSLSSSGFRAKTPGASKEEDKGMIPVREIEPRVGLKPYTPLYIAGIMMLPRVSVPSAASQKPALTATAEPTLEPPQGKRPP